MTELSPSQSNQYDSYSFEALEAVQMDPELKVVFDKIRTYNSLLATEPQDQWQINAIMQELDQDWSMVVGLGALFTGCAWFNDEATYDGRYDQTGLARDYYEEQEMTFRGAYPFEVGEAPDDSDKQYYEMRILLNKEALNQNGERQIMSGTAKVDDVIGLEFPQTLSLERARRILEYYHPDAIDEIDVALMNEYEAPIECNALMKLAEVSVTPSNEIMQDPTTMRRIGQALGVYTNSLLTFDEEAPYAIVSSGEIWVYGDSRETVIGAEAELSTLVKARGIVWEDRPTGDSSQTLYPFVLVDILQRNKDDPSQRVLVPADSLQDFSSMRYEHLNDASGDGE